MIKTDLLNKFCHRDEFANKSDFGRALFVCGSYGMAGAAVLGALACVKSGVGICSVATDERIYPIVTTSVPEAVCLPISREFTVDEKYALKSEMKKADVIVLGCGLGTDDFATSLVYCVAEHARVPVIVDADALNIIAKDKPNLSLFKCDVIITPHPGEFSRLTGKTIPQIQSDRVAHTTDFAKKHGVITLLKGKDTVISNTSGAYFINETGNSGMATGGSGDMLCGIIAAFVAQGMTALDATRVGAYIHGLSGDLSAQKYSKMSTSATTMISCLPEIFLQIENNL